MDKFEQLEQEIHDKGIEIDFVVFKSDRIKGLCCDNSIALSKSLRTSAEKSCVAAEELAHHQLTTGNIVDLSDVRNRKQEQRARLQAYNNQVGLIGFVHAYEHGCCNHSEISEYLEVTEEFLKEVIECYRSKYGTHIKINNYIIKFEPFIEVIKLRPN